MASHGRGKPVIDRRHDSSLTIPSLASSSSSRIEPFPSLTPDQHAALSRIIAALPPSARTWAELRQTKREVEGETEDEEDPAGDDTYPLFLKLVFQEGVTWKEKWEGVHAQLREREGGRTEGGGTGRPRAGGGGGGLELLKARMDQVTLSSTTTRRPPSSPANGAALPPPARPRSTPAAASSRQSHPPSTNTTREFLVRRTEAGHSSSDDFVGVPGLQALSLARRRKEREREERTAPLLVPTPTSTARTEKRNSLPTPFTTTPVQQPRYGTSTPAPPWQSTPSRSSRHPLLDRRLAELGFASPAVPATPLSLPSNPIQQPDSPAPASHRSFLRPAPSQPSQLSQPSPLQNPTSRDATALLFRRLRLLSTHFDAWRSLFHFESQRTSELDARRSAWLARCSLRQWASRAAQVRQLREREAAWARTEESRGRAVKGWAWRRWREGMMRKEDERKERQARERREVREGELRWARTEAVRRRNVGVLKRALERWRLATLESLAFRFRLRYLPLRPLLYWRSALSRRLAHRETLESVAEEVWAGSEEKRAVDALRVWKKKTSLRRAQRMVEERWEEGMKRGSWVAWVDKTRQASHVRQLSDLASQHDAQRLASRSLSYWRTRLSHVSALSSASASLQTDFSSRFLRRTLISWTLATRVSLHLHARSLSLARKSLAHWLSKLDHLQIELEGRALALTQRRDGQFLRVAFGAWRESTAHHSRLNAAAEAVSRRTLLTKAFGGWRKRREERQLESRKADVVRDFFGQRGAWRRWVDRSWERKRARWVDGRVRLRKREAMEFWIDRTQQRQNDRRLVQVVQTRIDQRILGDHLLAWKERIMLRRELEREAAILYEGRLVHSGFKRWAERTVEAAERLSQADRFRADKAEELRDATFQRWVQLARRSLTLKQRLATRLEQQQRATLENAFGTWRERRLRKMEVQIVEGREARNREEAFGVWKRSTKTLMALQSYKTNLLNRTLTCWRYWAPAQGLVQQAIDLDHRAVTGNAFEVWRIKAQARVALKALSGRLRGTQHSPFSRLSPSFGLPRPVSPSSALDGSPRFGRSLNSFSSSLSLSSPSRDPSTAASSFYPPSTSQIPLSSSPLDRPSRRLSTASLSTQPLPHPPARPRLSAEYSAPTPPPRRTRSRSVASVKSSRSAPAAAGTRYRTDDGEDDESEEWRDCALVRSEGRPGGRDEDGDGDGGGGESSARDVRKGYEALRARLRAAAASAAKQG
ncbi:hypothetical protein JCM1841_001474 [Sporobolomyces salmonicolor]